jgi:alkanesulfonate monooxygenase SsuD/methylene tetrahydromethanopterin reductase-like flavin-dependent oxidoreductase (luciferase family)
LHDPVRVAEDAATVDLISNGRLILGIGAGWRAEEFEAFGVGMDERASRVRETVSVLRGAWGPGPFRFAGKHYSYDNLNVTPKPARTIPIWIGGFAPGAIRRAGRIADGFLGSSTGTSGIAAFAQAKDLALAGVERSGRDPDSFTFALHVPVYASSGRDPWDEVKPHYAYLRWKYADMGGARGSANPSGPPPPSPEQEAQLRQTIICGSPDEVAAEIGAFRDALGGDIHFICRSDFPGMPSAQQLELIERIGAEVLPQL